jgi:outer membrane lipoprotein SlyB
MTAPFQEHTIATRRSACLPTMLGSLRLEARRLTLTEHKTIERTTVSGDGVTTQQTTQTTGAPASTTKTLEKGVHHGDEEAGGALGGAVGGAVVGAVVGGPVGAVVGGAIGAASGASAGALDDKHKDEAVVVTKEEKTW